MGLYDTIAAISTPRGCGGIAVIRISGADAISIAGRVFYPASGRHLAEYPPREAVYGEITSPAGEHIDCGMATLFRSPRSYTGEDSVEISCHGGVYVTREVLSAVLSAGARMAQAGEFTRRALISGKLTLTEAEAVGELIDADTSEKMRLASSAVKGILSEKIESMAQNLTNVMSALYAAIDYPDEDIGDEGERELDGVLDGTLSDVRKLLSTYKRGRAVSDGVECVICGLPNAGKSSLYNRINGEDRAIVTDIAGTTRDVLTDRVSFGGVTLNLADTAGLRRTDDTVEKIGVDRALSEIDSSQLILYVIDSSCVMTDDERERISALPNVPKIAVLNKSDRQSMLAESDISYIEQEFTSVIRVSCESAFGIDDLSVAVGNIFDSGACDIGHDPIIWSARHEATLSRCADYLEAALDGLRRGDPTDAVCTLCESAISELRETDGRGVSSDIIDGIFRRFCVGK